MPLITIPATPALVYVLVNICMYYTSYCLIVGLYWFSSNQPGVSQVTYGLSFFVVGIVLLLKYLEDDKKKDDDDDEDEDEDEDKDMSSKSD
jgi:hypothetical protein